MSNHGRCISTLSLRASSWCSAGKLISLEELARKNVSLNSGGSLPLSEVIRINYGQFDGQDSDFMICDAHEGECRRKIAGTKNRLCGMPEAISTHPGKSRTSLRSLSYKQCKSVYKEHEILIPPGKSVCIHCYEEVIKITDEFVTKEKAALEATLAAVVSQRQEETGYELRKSTAMSSIQQATATAASPSSSQQQQSFDSLLYLPSPVARTLQQDRAKEESGIFASFAQLSGLQDLRIARTEFNEMNKKSQATHVDQARMMIDEVIRRLCPKEPQQLWNALVDQEITKRASEQQEEKLLQMTVQAYLEAESSSHKLQLLSLLASSVSVQECQERIPGLSKTQYYRAKAFARDVGAGMIKEVDREVYVCYDATSVEHFINYALSFNVVSDLPFGKAMIKLSNGEELTVPNVIRDSVPERIVQKYRRFCTEELESGKLPPSFSHLKRTTLLEILDICKASKRKALQGLDYFTAAGGNAFDTFKAIVNELMEKGHITNELKKDLVRELQTAKNYLKSEFKGHVSMHSMVADHCITFALSDQSSDAFSSSCGESHNVHCEQCDSLSAVMQKISAAISQSMLSLMEKADLQFQFDGAERDIHLWKAHKLRVINQDLARQMVVQQLRPNQLALIVMDWAMKLLPIWYREDMSKFFGKRGMPWHVAVATIKTESGFETRTFLHCFDQCKQDSDAVLAILKDVLVKLKAEKPNMEDIYLRADNAGCYHSAQTILSLPSVMTETGVRIRRFDFSDPQGGKADCDRMAATVKRHINMFVAEKNNCTTGKEFVDAIESHGGIPGVSIHYGKLELVEGAVASKKPTIKGISNIFNVEYTDNCIQSWKAFDIGVGQKISNKQECRNTTCFKETYGTQRPVQCRNLGECKKLQEIASVSTLSDNEAEEIDAMEIELPEQEQGQKLFSCGQEGCTKEYRYEAHLERHYLIGEHKYSAPKMSLKDFAMKSYKKQLEDPERTNIFGECLSSVSTAQNLQVPHLDSGWALKQQKRVVQFSEKQRDFLKDKFKEGEETTIKYMPEQVAKLMRTATTADGEPVFTKEEFLNRNQIFSYFSRLAASKRLADETDLSLMDLVEIKKEQQELDKELTISSIHRTIRDIVHAEEAINISSQSAHESEQVATTESAIKRKSASKSKKRCAPSTEPMRPTKRFDSDDEDEPGSEIQKTTLFTRSTRSATRIRTRCLSL